ncbi:MAG: hypothetical protein K2J01_05085 [Clostridiales bacterium]|nr:hypothetical protein [Clostridiales bacterium]
MSDSPATEKNKASGKVKVTDKLKKFLTSRKGEVIVLTFMSVLALLFTVIFYSIKFTDLTSMPTGRDKFSFWTANDFLTESLRSGGGTKAMRVYGMNIYLSIAFAVGAALYIVAWVLMALKKKNKLLYVLAAAYNAILGIVCLVFGTVLSLMRGGAVACCIISVFCSVTALAYLIMRRRIDRAAKQEVSWGTDTALTDKQRKYKLALLICECVALFVLATVLFIPVYSEGAGGITYVLINSVGANKYPVYVSIGFIVMIIALFGEMLYFISTVSDYFGGKTFAIRSRHFVLSTTIFTLIFFILGYCLKFYYNLSGGANAEPREAMTVSYIPFVLSVVTMIVYSVFSGKFPVGENGEVLHRHIYKPFKLEPLFAVLAITVITFAALAVNIIEVYVKIPAADFEQKVTFTGFELLTKYKELESGFQMLSFVEFAFLLMSGILFVLTLIGFISKDKSYYKTVKVAAIANLFFVLLIGLFGVYFEIGQKINMESIESVLAHYNIKLPEDSYVLEVTSKTIYMLLASVAVIVYMITRKMFGLSAEPTEWAMAQTSSAAMPNARVGEDKSVAPQSADTGTTETGDFDACPAFTEIDNLQEKFLVALEKRRAQLFKNLTLPNLVRFVVDYARESRLHLSYTPDDIATFVAGLGASRLTILQGMSGTGKTSLPKIFTEALMSNCEIVEVESSWRDKNELLGYYNEFSKCYTPKKFTQCLYRARLNTEVISFIVLDEMNLSRIEYYFSDFLSLMENEEDRRAIKLLNVKLSRLENGKRIPYDGLKDGHTIKIPTNIWFIGTANRDESTFEISDKVYDRAQTMNFDKRAAKIDSFSEPLEKRFVSYDMLAKLFEEAKSTYKFDAEENRFIREVEKLLMPYNISFGNRILRQIETFVKVYCACFGDQAAVENTAVEKILLSKVVRKLENKVIENKEKLATEFDKIGLKQCSAFVRKLNED